MAGPVGRIAAVAGPTVQARYGIEIVPRLGGTTCE